MTLFVNKFKSSVPLDQSLYDNEWLDTFDVSPLPYLKHML